MLSVLGISRGMLIGGLTFDDVRPWSPGVLLLALGVTTAILAIFAAVAARLQHPAPSEPITELIRRGESDRLEFKSSARWNLHTRARDEKIEMVIAKAVAGFLNTDGGTLLIGVNDDGDVRRAGQRLPGGEVAGRRPLRTLAAGLPGQHARPERRRDARHRLHPGHRRRRGHLRLPGDLPVVAAPGVRPAGQGRRSVGDCGCGRATRPGS